MAIKGKKKTKGRRPKAAAPKPVVVTPKQPLVARRWFQVVVVALIVAGIAGGIGYGFGHQSTLDEQAADEAATTKALTTYKKDADAALRNVGYPTKEGFGILTKLPTATAVRQGAVSDREVSGLAQSAIKEAKAANEGLNAIDVDKLIPGLQPTIADHIVGSRDEMAAAMEMYRQHAVLLKEAVASDGHVRTFLLEAAERLRGSANAVFSRGYNRFIGILKFYGLYTPPEQPGAPAGGLPGGLPAGIPEIPEGDSGAVPALPAGP